MSNPKLIVSRAKVYSLLTVVSTFVPLAVMGQVTTVFQDNFTSGSLSTLNPTVSSPGTLTAGRTAYEIASSKNATGTTIASGVMTYGNFSTSSGYCEGQALFTASPVTLNTVGQYIEVYYTFTDTTTLFNGNANDNEQISIGLYNSGGSGPTNGTALWNSGLSSSLTTGDIGCTKGWLGYCSEIAYTKTTSLQPSAIYTRPAQTAANNSNQGLCPVSGYASGVNMGQLSGVTGQPALTVGNQYTVDLKIYYASATTLIITNTLYNGAGVGGSVFSTGGFTALNSATVTGANLLTTTFDGLCIGFRPTSNPGTAETMQINNVTVLLVTPVAPSITGLTNETVVAGSSPTLSPTVSGVPTPACQWYVSTDGGATSNSIAGATNTTLTLANVQYSQNNYLYTLVAANSLGTNAAGMTLSVIVPPSITGMNNQAAGVGTTVTISPTVSGVPTPTLQWQTNGVNVTDGPDVNGSTISGSTTSTLTITGAQTGDSGTYSLIASNSAGIVTNSMNLIVSSGNVAPTIAGPTNITVVQGNNGTYSASASGVPVPALQWLDQTKALIAGATNNTLTLTNVQYAQNGFTYYITASNSVGSVTNSAVLTVIVPPAITSQPANLIVTNTQAAAFTVAATGAPAVGYQWSKNGAAISSAANSTATNATFTIANASPADDGNYFCTITNQAGTTNTVTVTLTVDSTMSVVSMTPANGAAGVAYDTPLYLTFSVAPTERAAGNIKIYNATNAATPVDIINLALNVTNNAAYAANVQPYTIGGSGFTNFPVIINGTTAAIYPHHGVLTSNQTYYVTLDNGTFSDSAGAYFAGISNTSAWRFTTKVTGPAVATNLVVAQDYSGDFATVEGAVDSVPANNTTPTTINIRNGTYTEVVNVQSKNNITFRGQSRAGTVIAYPNNSWVYGNTHSRMTFKISANNIALDNLTVSNSTPLGGSQAEALMVESGASSNVVNNCNVDSYQDTILANQNNSRVYFYNSLIQGNVDFIWGGGVLFFTNCEIRYNAVGAYGPNPSPSSTDINSNGFSFVNCQFTTIPNAGSCLVGRTRSITNANMAMINCFVSTNIGGWSSDALPTNNFRNWYYSCTNDLGATVTLSNGIALSPTDVNLTNASSSAIWLYGWQPTLTPNILTNPVGQTVTAGSPVSFTVAATGIPDPTYQWLKNGTNIPAATSATLTIGSTAVTDAGNYSVVVTTPAGSATSSMATLVVNAPATPVVVPWTLLVNTNNIINATSYGAVGDGVTTNTASIQAAINAAAVAGITNGLRGGTVEIPASGIYLCGPLNMSNNVNLQVDAGAILRMLPYGMYPGYPYTGTALNFISGTSLTNIELSGSGAIDGQGSPWWQANNTNSAINRPIMIDFSKCNRLLIQSITLSNSPMFHLSIGSGNVTVQGVTVSAPSSSDPVNPSHNTDACDVGGTNILVENCNISTGDDDFTCGGNTFGVLLTNNVYGTGHGVSVGSYTDNGGVSNIMVINCSFNGTDNGIRLKSERGRGGLVQNLTYCNLTMTNVGWPLLVYSYYEYGLGTLTGVNPTFAANVAATNSTTLNSTTPIWRNVTFSNITATAVPAGRPPLMVWGLPEAPASNIVFRAINITSSSTLAPGVYNGTNIQFVDCNFNMPTGIKDMQFWNAGLLFTNTFGNLATTTNLWSLDGLTTNGIGNTLQFNNALATLTNTNALDDGPLTLAASTFTISNNLTLFPTTVLNYTLSTNATKLAVTGNLMLGGTNNIYAGAGFTNGTYTLMTYGGNLSGSLPVLGVTPSGFTCTLNTNTAGQVNLTVITGNSAAPVITNIAPSSATLIAGNGTNIVVGASGTPVPVYFWYNNSNQLVQASASQTLSLANVQLSGAGVYSVTASNSVGAASTNFTISVVVAPVITSQPTNQLVNLGDPASFSVTATGVPAPGYQWFQNSLAISGATNATYSIPSVTATNAGVYDVVVSNTAGTVTSSNAVLLIKSTSLAITALAPGNNATGVCYDTPLYITFNQPPTIGTVGSIRIYNVTNNVTPVDTITISSAPQPRNIGGDTGDNFLVYPVIVTGNTAEIYPHESVMTSNQTYYVLVDSGAFVDSTGAFLPGISATNTWQFKTKPTGPLSRTNVVVAGDYSGDFATVQGAIDSVAIGNTTPTVINVRNGLYQELVNVYSRNNLLFRGQSRSGTQVGYPNNNNINPNTHTRMALKVSANDISFDGLTITNMTSRSPSEVQAEALMIESGALRATFNNCDIDGFQDTILANQVNSRAYFKNCLVQGDVDFIWGGGNLYFTNCEIRYLTRPGGAASFGPNPSPSSTDINSNGFSFVSCAFTTQAGANPNDVIGRTRGITNANMALINCFISTNIGGWNSDAAPVGNFRNWYYNCTNDTGAAVTLSNGIALASTDVNLTNASSAIIWLYAWQASLSPNITSQPISQVVNAGQSVSLSASATGIPDPAYQWLKNGTNLTGQTGATLTISNASGFDMGTYSVMATNSAGTVASGNAVLTVNFPATAPALSSATVVAGGSVQFSITSANGSAGFGYRVWASTNLALRPVTNTWLLLTNGVFGASPTSFADPSMTNQPQRFYLITVP